MKNESTNGKTGLLTRGDIESSESSSPLMRDIPRPKSATFIDKLQVKAHEQKRIPLGSFIEETQPKGFLVEIDPDPSPANSVITEITSLGSGSRYTLYLLVSNFSSKAVSADIWRL